MLTQDVMRSLLQTLMGGWQAWSRHMGRHCAAICLSDLMYPKSTCNPACYSRSSQPPGVNMATLKQSQGGLI